MATDDKSWLPDKVLITTEALSDRQIRDLKQVLASHPTEVRPLHIPDYTSVAARAVARDIMVTPSAVKEIADLLGGADGYAVARYAADLVCQHAASLGMDPFAAGVLTRAILAAPEAVVAKRAEAAHG